MLVLLSSISHVYSTTMLDCRVVTLSYAGHDCILNEPLQNSAALSQPSMILSATHLVDACSDPVYPEEPRETNVSYHIAQDRSRRASFSTHTALECTSGP